MKIQRLMLAALLLSGCNGKESSLKESEVYLSFDSVKLDAVKSSSSHTCVFYSDKTARFNFDETESFSWQESSSGLILKGKENTIHLNFDRASAKHYFFYDISGEVYRFNAKDTDYVKKMNADYKPFYEANAKFVFSGIGKTSGISTIGTITFLDDEDHTVYYAQNGMNGIDTKYLSIGEKWKQENDVFSFILNEKKYQSTFSTEKGYSFLLYDTEYTMK